jgi:NADH-quinone oxidoreductase subunit H
MVEFVTLLGLALLKGALILALVVLPGAVLFIYYERKVSAWIQLRIGPNRVGPFGLFQPFADVTKLLMKEDIVPVTANKRFHFLAPLISITTAVAAFAVTPFADYLLIGNTRIDIAVAPSLNVALLYILAVSSVAVYGVTFAGWSSGNKYSLLGGLRSSAQMISYELSMGLALVSVVLMVGSLNVGDIVRAQGDFRWHIFLQPISFLIFLVASFAETNRAPFDLPEAEPELVGGYHTEYTGMKFGILFLSELAHAIAAATLISTLFLGGWQIPVPLAWLHAIGIQDGSIWMVLLQVGSFLAKTAFFVFFFIWVRWSLPRFRYDQLMNLGWKIMLPLALANILITSTIIFFMK